MKKLLSIFVAMAFALCILGGCSSSSSPAGTSSGPKNDAIKIDQIDWKVENKIIDKYRRIAFSYTNNSNYTIVGLELNCSMKPDVTPESMRQAFDALKENGMKDSDLDEISDFTQDQIASFIITGEWNQAVAPGATSGSDPMLVGYLYINTMEQYELAEPSMMTIKYLDSEDMLYEETYDFRTKSYSLADEVIDTHQWSESELASLLPEPEGLYVTKMSDSDTRFTFDTIGTTPSEFQNYVKACKEKGFTKNISETDRTFYVKSSDGKYDLDLFYYPESGSISAYLDVE